MTSKVDFNPFIEFYGKHNISPVHQDINDIRVHLQRREKLYRQLGVFPNVFKNKRILEIGPGGGFNAIAFFAWGATIDFIEPNRKAQEELPELFDKYGIDKNRWNLYCHKIEDANTDKKYDIIIAEGFLPGILNQKEVVDIVSSLLNNGGMVSVTCVDEISVFFEIIKRQIAYILIREVETFEEKVAVLARAFSTHLASLKGASRPIEDWVVDCFLNPWIKGNLFSIEDCIRFFGDDFEILGASPGLFNDLSWYKDLSENINDNYIVQFNKKRHLFMITGMKESIEPEKFNKKLFKCVSEIKELCKKNEDCFNYEIIFEIIEKLFEIKKMTAHLDLRISAAIEEAIRLLRDRNLNCEKISNAENLKSAFGKGQQYISLKKSFIQFQTC